MDVVEEPETTVVSAPVPQFKPKPPLQLPELESLGRRLSVEGPAATQPPPAPAPPKQAEQVKPAPAPPSTGSETASAARPGATKSEAAKEDAKDNAKDAAAAEA